MASVFDAAKYILKKNGSMSAMKLQKLCYYSQAWSLVWDDCELFPEEFEAWANGPVCRELFEYTKGKFKISYDDEKGDVSNLDDNQRDTVDHVLDFYGKHDAQWLSQLTHMEDPWKIARGNTPVGERCDNIITKSSMAVYYGGLS